MKIKIPQPAGESPTPVRLRIIKIVEVDSSGQDMLPPRFAVVEGSDPFRVLFECSTYDEALEWIRANYPNSIP